MNKLITACTKTNKVKAFTLVEVLVALVLLTFSMGTLVSAISSTNFQLTQLRDRFHANRVAMHVAGQYYLLDVWPKLGTIRKDIDIGKSVWEWEAKVKRTSEKRMRRIEIRVYTDLDPERSIAHHILFATNPSDKIK